MANNVINKNKKNKVLKIILISVASVLGLLFASYLILLVSLGALDRFGQPFWFEGGRVYFGDRQCCDEERLHCSVTADPYSWCSCESKNHYNGQEIFPVDKPIIYLYPSSETVLNIKLGRPENLTTTYPKYELSGWNVLAYPNGDLIDLNTSKKLYALYWEGKSDFDNIKFDKGFVVSGEDSARFLEEKLELLGLNYKESEEFITYWLPKLEKNPFNYVYFMTTEEIEKDMPIEVSVKPDTTIRIRMIFQGLDQYEAIQEQILEPAPTRSGFTLVEWGGSEIE